MADDQLDQLETRITLLECLVFGTSDKDALYPKCIESLHNVQTKTNASVQGRKRISQAYSKLADIHQYLDPSYTDELTVSDSAKANTILADEDFIRQQTACLETMESLQDCINSEHMKGTHTVVGMSRGTGCGLHSLWRPQPVIQVSNGHKIIQGLEELKLKGSIIALPKNTSQFQELSRVQLSQQDKTAEITDEVRNILSSYNNIVSMVSKQFVQWDETITKLEMAKLAKK